VELKGNPAMFWYSRLSTTADIYTHVVEEVQRL
jgi:hypothetical protein